jgi:hypothetical protein
VFSGGAATANSKDYTALAKEKSFESIFPSRSRTYYFADLDEAYDFVNIAHAKFTQASGKKKAKGLAAKLIGPPITREKPVTVCYFLEAAKENKGIDLSKIDEPLEKVIKDATSAALVFMVFYGDRGAAISNFHLASGWVYNSNSQVKHLNYNNTRYETNYPFGWGTDKAFSYLRKEIN